MQVQAAIRQAEAEKRWKEAKLQTIQFEMQLLAMKANKNMKFYNWVISTYPLSAISISHVKNKLLDFFSFM